MGSAEILMDLIKKCIQRRSLAHARCLHAHILKTPEHQTPTSAVVTNHLIDMYAACGSLDEATRLFRSMPRRDKMSWNRMLKALTTHSSPDTARQLFDEMHHKNDISWNTMISAYSRAGKADTALHLFEEMQKQGIKSNNFTFSTIVNTCSRSRNLAAGKRIHAMIIKSGDDSDEFVGSSLLDLYAKCDLIDDARQVFAQIPTADDCVWGAMIAGYVRHAKNDNAVSLFRDMFRHGMQASDITFTTILSICIGALQTACLHGVAVKQGHCPSSRSVNNCLVDAYSRCGKLDDARQVFDEMPSHDEVSWNAIIGACARNGDGDGALELFYGMHNMATCKVDGFTLASVLSACASIAMSEQGKQLHGIVVKSGFQSDVCLGSGLLDMYAKCGEIDEARRVFDEMEETDIVAWTAMIGGYAQNGLAFEAIGHFEMMLNSSSCSPNPVTFLGVLSACRHAGLVEEAFKYLKLMQEEFGITPELDHYGCMVDLLGKNGRLEEAHSMIKSLPLQPSAVIWVSLLASCRKHGDVELGAVAAEQVVRLEPRNSSAYIMLSNTLAQSGRWADAKDVRSWMKDVGAEKSPGCSWIEIRNEIHTFTAEDADVHPESREILSVLENLMQEIKQLGYVSDTSCVLHDIEEEQKMKLLSRHSEKLALAYGFIRNPPSKPIKIVKNIRICGDCHNAMKLISHCSKRHIVIRDVSRYHHFKDGVCSCGDYW